jgi:hypothetical protein
LRVLDLGTARGDWADDFAIAHPKAEVYGTDLGPIQITRPWENSFFQVEDFEEEWTWRVPFDFVHGRDLLSAVGNWSRLLEQVFRHLQPGGYIELQHQVFHLDCEGIPIRPDLEARASGMVWKDHEKLCTSTIQHPTKCSSGDRRSLKECGIRGCPQDMLSVGPACTHKRSAKQDILTNSP